MIHPLLQKQDELFTEATQLLQQIIIPTFSEFGNVIIGGSYVYRLLTYPDIDIDIVSDDVSDVTYKKLCDKVTSLDSVSEFKTLDRTERPVIGTRPKGYWLSPKIQYGNNLWNIDIWFQKPEWNTGNTLMYKDALLKISDEQRIVILTLKNELRENDLYGVGKEFQSVDVYDAVLNSGAYTLEMLRTYKHSL
ncbi:hypothetical protein IPH92_04065 [Candidatus Kaiserbacteria bacterium]|nr:MAG: hypothetical protein IPH92_04065 [Candidatus Kaiserbacteria bacterium]